MTKLLTPEDFQRRTKSDADALEMETEYRRLEDIVFRAQAILARPLPEATLDTPEVREALERARADAQRRLQLDAEARARAQHDLDTCAAIMRSMEAR